MTKLSKVISIAALITAGVAQTGFAQTQTDEILDLTFNLTAYSQGAATTSGGVTTDLQATKITSKSIIQVLGTAMGHTFSKKAKLVALAPTNFLDAWTIQIQDGTNAAVDVSGFFGHQPGFPSVDGAWINNTTGVSGTTDYSVDSFSLQDQYGYPTLSMHFNVSGFTVITSSTVLNSSHVVVGQADSVVAHVSGSGDEQGNTTVIHGSIKAEGVGTEDVSTVGPTS